MIERATRYALAGAVWLAGVLPLHVHAAESAVSDIQALRESQARMVQQLEALSARVAQLEQANAELASRGTPAPAPTAVAKSPALLERFKFNADLRVRVEHIEQDGLADRDRERVQSHFGFEAALAEEMALGLQFATGNDDPRSANQTFSGIFSRKPIGVDLAYLRWTPVAGLAVTGGKMKYPVYRPAISKLYDSDVNPEGFAVSIARPKAFASLYSLTLDERAEDSDARLVGAQLGTKLALGAVGSLTAAVGFSDLGAAVGRRPFFAGSSNGNSLNPDGTLAFDFRVTQASLEYARKLGDLPVVAFVDGARNAAAPDTLDTAYAFGFLLGKAATPRTWEFAYLYQRVEKDSWFGQITDSDFGAGLTDTRGSVFRFGYAPMANGIVNATYYLNDLGIDAPSSPGATDEYQRFQLDFTLKF
jgi:hypothetical protein